VEEALPFPTFIRLFRAFLSAPVSFLFSSASHARSKLIDPSPPPPPSSWRYGSKTAREGEGEHVDDVGRLNEEMCGRERKRRGRGPARKRVYRGSTQCTLQPMMDPPKLARAEGEGLFRGRVRNEGRNAASLAGWSARGEACGESGREKFRGPRPNSSASVVAVVHSIVMEMGAPTLAALPLPRARRRSARARRPRRQCYLSAARPTSFARCGRALEGGGGG